MIYTGKGDKGESEIFGGERFSKDNQIFEVLGVLDELNSLIGVCKTKAQNFDEKILDLKLEEILEKIQKDLFIIQSNIVGADKHIKEENIKWLEENIDFIEKEIPELKKFIITGGSELAIFLNYTRTIVRKVERKTVTLNKKQELDSNILIYLNRLSDLFFMLYRFVNFKKGCEEKYF